MPNLSSPNMVACAIPEARVSEVLAAIHRHGFGHCAKLLPLQQKNAVRQLEKADIPTAVAEQLNDPSTFAVLLLDIPGRIEKATALLQGIPGIHFASYTSTQLSSSLLAYQLDHIHGGASDATSN